MILAAAFAAASLRAETSVDLVGLLTAADVATAVRGSGGGLLLRPGGRAAVPVDVPPGARLVLELERDRGAAWGDGARLTLVAEADGMPPRELAARAFAGAPWSAPSRHVVALDALAGRAVRLTVELEPGGSTRGDGCVLRRLALEVNHADPAEADRRLRASLPVYAPVVAPRRAPSADRPSVLVFLLDALRALDLSCYGEANPTTPHLDRLARAGVTFAEHFSQAPNTPPSVKALLTGRYLPATGHARLPDEEQTIPEVLGAAGYATALFSNTPFAGPLMGTHQGFAHHDVSLYVSRHDMYASTPPPKRYAQMLADAYRSWLPDGPSFAYLHAVHPHNPYAPLPPWNRLLAEPGSRAPYDGTTATLMAVLHGKIPLDADAVARHHRLLYQEDLASADHALASVLAELRRRGRQESTLVALVADHGEEFLEHGGILHGYTAYDEMLQVPLLLAGAGLPRGAVVRSLTQTIDLAPTIYDACGVPFPEGIQGMTLLPLAAGAGPRRADVYASASSVPGIYSLRTARYKYVYAPGRSEGAKGGDEPAVAPRPAGRRAMVRRARVRTPGVGNFLGRKDERAYLYDLAADPREQRNVVREQPVRAELMHRRLMSWLAEVEGRGAVGAGTSEEDAVATLPQEECEQLVALGYLEAAQCPCSCDRLRAHWPAHADGSLSGPLAAAVRDQLTRCPDCKAAFEAWRAGATPRP